jgi:hypothetical protein
MARWNFVASLVCKPLRQVFAGSGDAQHEDGPPRPHPHSALHESLLQDGDDLVDELVEEGRHIERTIMTTHRVCACDAVTAASVGVVEGLSFTTPSIGSCKGLHAMIRAEIREVSLGAMTIPYCGTSCLRPTS